MIKSWARTTRTTTALTARNVGDAAVAEARMNAIAARLSRELRVPG